MERVKFKSCTYSASNNAQEVYMVDRVEYYFKKQIIHRRTSNIKEDL